MPGGLKFNQSGWNTMIREIVDTEGVERMQRVADACNNELKHPDGYRVSTEGTKPLSKHGYRATVITATADAMINNAKNETLVKNQHLAGGA